MSKHQANASVNWSGGFSGLGQVASRGISALVSLPKEFGGLNQGTSPEELFLSAMASCYLITLGIVLEKAGVRCEELSADASLITETGPPSCIEEVVLKVRVAADLPKEKLEQLASRVDEFCLVAKAARGLKKSVTFVQRRP